MHLQRNLEKKKDPVLSSVIMSINETASSLHALVLYDMLGHLQLFRLAEH